MTPSGPTCGSSDSNPHHRTDGPGAVPSPVAGYPRRRGRPGVPPLSGPGAQIGVEFGGRHRLPHILSVEEVGRLLSSPRPPKHRLLLTTTYAAGLRVSEVRIGGIPVNILQHAAPPTRRRRTSTPGVEPATRTPDTAASLW